MVVFYITARLVHRLYAAAEASHSNSQASAELKQSLYLAEVCQGPLEVVFSIGYWACV